MEPIDESKVQELARTLRASGLVAGFDSAERMARVILAGKEPGSPVKIVKQPSQQATPRDLQALPSIDELPEIAPRGRPAEQARCDYDITKETKSLLELMNEDAEAVYSPGKGQAPAEIPEAASIKEKKEVPEALENDDA